ncbi:uncharacterized protein LOC143603572 [Bidens hawaiensis]|uniref:uncharacterized protein LOC143603572 n=1 Tax=Bidens hawaiensis TaxID=980011 RepID=UPI00404B7877
MAAGDEDKTAFRTDQGIFCYKMMPFGWKNAGATYQLLMDKAFKSQIGHNLEVYIELPTLSTPQAREPLTLYISVLDIAIGAVSLTDSKTVRIPICYVSITLTDAETSKPELSGRLAKWVIELGEHTIDYKPRPAIKGHILADFITEVPQNKEAGCLNEQQTPSPPKEDQVWSLFTDGASSGEGFGVGLRLVNSEEHEFNYAIKLYFKSINNEAEYEAFLAGLRITKKLDVKHLEAHVDSMLIAEQINGSYEAKNEVMAPYLSQAKELILKFLSCKVIHIKSSEKKNMQMP